MLRRYIRLFLTGNQGARCVHKGGECIILCEMCKECRHKSVLNVYDDIHLDDEDTLFDKGLVDIGVDINELLAICFEYLNGESTLSRPIDSIVVAQRA